MTDFLPQPRKSSHHGSVYVGCAGWSIPRNQTQEFPQSGSHLERYATCFSAVEINSSFYRPHRPATYVRWANSVASNFLFAVKIPKKITHQLQLSNTHEELEKFVSECSSLGEKLGCLLVQLPPRLKYDPVVAELFFQTMRNLISVDIACEPRHATWFSTAADEMFTRHRVTRVAADPKRAPYGDKPAGWEDVAYFRLHGSPKVYYSSYNPEFLNALAAELNRRRLAGQNCWCIFDNTAEGAAVDNARQIMHQLSFVANV